MKVAPTSGLWSTSDRRERSRGLPHMLRRSMGCRLHYGKPVECKLLPVAKLPWRAIMTSVTGTGTCDMFVE